MTDVCMEVVTEVLEPFVKKGNIAKGEMLWIIAKIAVECYRQGVKDGKHE